MKIVKYCIVVLAVISATTIGLVSCMRSGTLKSISVTPATAIIAAGTTQQFTATATFTDNTTLNWTSAVTWSSSDPVTGAPTDAALPVSNSIGSHGLATSLDTNVTGTFTITAIDTINNTSGTATIIVTSTPLVSITVTPANSSIAVGATQQFTATGIYADGTTRDDLTPIVTWSSSNTGVVSISNTAGSNGAATAVASGSATITATDPMTHASGNTMLMVQ